MTKTGRQREKTRQKWRYFRLPPNLAHRKLIDLANYVPSFSPWGVLSFSQRFFKDLEKMAFDVRSSRSRLLRRMKACIDEFQPNASQANYFEGFWKVIFTSHKAGQFFQRFGSIKSRD